MPCCHIEKHNVNFGKSRSSNIKAFKASPEALNISKLHGMCCACKTKQDTETRLVLNHAYIGSHRQTRTYTTIQMAYSSLPQCAVFTTAHLNQGVMSELTLSTACLPFLQNMLGRTHWH